MFLKLIDYILSWILVKDLQDAMIGDLWESYHQMVKQGKPKASVFLVIIWSAILLVFASCQIIVERVVEKIDLWALEQEENVKTLLELFTYSLSKKYQLSRIIKAPCLIDLANRIKSVEHTFCISFFGLMLGGVFSLTILCLLFLVDPSYMLSFLQKFDLIVICLIIALLLATSIGILHNKFFAREN